MIDYQREIRRYLKDNRKYMTRQQIKTIDGQIKSGDIDGALKGIEKIIKRSDTNGTKKRNYSASVN